MPNPKYIQQDLIKEIIQKMPADMLEKLNKPQFNPCQMFGAPDINIIDIEPHGIQMTFTIPSSEAMYHESVVMSGSNICSPHSSTYLQNPDEEFEMPEENVFSIAGAGFVQHKAGLGIGAHRANNHIAEFGVHKEIIADFELKPEIEWKYTPMDFQIKKEPINFEVGKRYLIETKKGQIKKYLSFIDERTDTYYFVDKKEKVNSAKTGWMFASRGTAHSTYNIIKEVE